MTPINHYYHMLFNFQTFCSNLLELSNYVLFLHYCNYSVAGPSLLLLHGNKLAPITIMPRWIDFDSITIMLINLDRV